MLCDYGKTYEIAYSESSAVFLGELQEIKPDVINTTHQGKKEYLNAKFKVFGSWKLVDKEYVWINLPGKKSVCAEFEEGKIYLVFANRLGDDLFIDVNSRSSLANSDFAINDLHRLGETKLIVKAGEYSFPRNPSYDIAIAFFIVVICVLLIYRFLKKKSI
jgi:hypothetical protein